jgi:hypothetical protein
MEDTDMDIYISTEDDLCSCGGGFFDAKDAPALKAFIESLGYKVGVIETSEPFCDNLNPLRRKNIRAVNWNNPKIWETIYILEMQGKDYDEIAKAIGCPDSGYAIKLRGVVKHFAMYEKLEGKMLSPELITKYAQLLARSQAVTNSQIKSKIAKLINNGCQVGNNTYPECLKGFNPQCLVCPFNDDAGHPINDALDIERYNEVRSIKDE